MLLPVKPRERIISTARDLFRRHGIRGIGVDAIAEAAGTNKMTSIATSVRKTNWWRNACVTSPARSNRFGVKLKRPIRGNPLAQLHAWIRVGAECAKSNDGRGCDMANAAVELADTDHPARQVIEEFERKQRDRLAACP